MELFPAFLRLNGRRVLVVGGGPVAASKLAALAAAGAAITVVAPDVCPAIRDAGVRQRRGFSEYGLDGVWFVVAAAAHQTSTRARRARGQTPFLNAGRSANASVYLGGVVRRGGVTPAIRRRPGPALGASARRIRRALGGDLDRWMETAREPLSEGERHADGSARAAALDAPRPLRHSLPGDAGPHCACGAGRPTGSFARQEASGFS
jgi:siroheme synthase-like protein